MKSEHHEETVETIDELKDKLEDTFDHELADRLAKKQFENIELRIRLAESEATRRLLLMLFLMVLSFILVRATVTFPE